MKEIRLTEEDLRNLRSLGAGRSGKWLIGYLKRMKAEWFDPETLTVESLPVVQQAWKTIDAILVKPLEFSKSPKTSEKNIYE